MTMEAGTWSIIFAVICALIADEQDRSIIWGLVWGYLFGLLAVIVYLIIGKKEN